MQKENQIYFPGFDVMKNNEKLQNHVDTHYPKK